MTKMEEKIKSNVAAEFQFLAQDWSNFIMEYETLQSEFGNVKQDVLEIQNGKN